MSSGTKSDDCYCCCFVLFVVVVVVIFFFFFFFFFTRETNQSEDYKISKSLSAMPVYRIIIPSA